MIVQDGMRRMYEEQEDVFYYITLMNENYAHPAHAARAPRKASSRACICCSDGGETAKQGPRVQLLGSGTILREVIAAAELLEEDFGVAADVWSVTSFTELRRDGMAASSAGTCCIRRTPRARARSRAASTGTQGPVVAATDYMRDVRRPDPAVRCRRPLSRARHRRLRPQRLSREAAAASSRSTGITCAVAALKALADEGAVEPAVVAEAIAKYGIDAGARCRPGPCDDAEPRTEQRVADRGQGSRHRRLQGRPGHRGPRQAGRHGEGRGSAGLAGDPTRRPWRCRRRAMAW